jgi:hypothetical protein
MPATLRREAQSHTLDEHVKLIRDMVSRSMRDPESRILAGKIVSGSYDYKRNPKTGQEEPCIRAWGRLFSAPVGTTCKSRDDECEIERIWDFIVLNLRYTYDPADEDLFQTLKVSLTTGIGDCDDFTVAFATLLKQIGFRVIARVISTKDNPKQWVHIYPLVGLPKDQPTAWVPLDATVEGFLPGSEWPEVSKHKDFVL